MKNRTHPVSGCGESSGSHYPWVVEEEGAHLSPACLEEEEAYPHVHREEARGPVGG